MKNNPNKKNLHLADATKQTGKKKKEKKISYFGK